MTNTKSVILSKEELCSHIHDLIKRISESADEYNNVGDFGDLTGDDLRQAAYHLTILMDLHHTDYYAHPTRQKGSY